MISTHITATSANEFLPADFIEQNKEQTSVVGCSDLSGTFCTQRGLYIKLRKVFL